MKKNALVVLPIFFSACATTSTVTIPNYAEAVKQAEKEGISIPAKAEERISAKCDSKPIVLKKDETKGIPYTGLLFTTDKAICMKAIEAERDRLRKDLKTEILRRRTEEIIRDATYKQLDKKASRSWWERHGAAIMFASGGIVGMAIVTGVMYILTGGKSLNTTSTSTNR